MWFIENTIIRASAPSIAIHTCGPDEIMVVFEGGIKDHTGDDDRVMMDAEDAVDVATALLMAAKSSRQQTNTLYEYAQCYLEDDGFVVNKKGE